MGFVSDRVKTEYQKIDLEASATPIDKAYVEEAITILRTLRIYKTREVFLYLSAINLLNAAIKHTEYKKELGYGFIKGKALLAAKIIITRYRYNDIRYYYDTNEKCLYIDVYGVVFSFHNILEDPLIIETAAKSDRIVWPEIRLQRIATPLFELAKTMYNRTENI